ncbi:amidase [Stappia stellulata]|uniref:amidase n=1 Tax=Stappia stellulata TaxID=71235 RepID=UPI0003F58E04|nr:amidase [Stappia stellulata]
MIAYPTIAEAGRMLRAGAISSVDLTLHHLERIARLNDRIDAYLVVLEEPALAAAERADAAFRAGADHGPMHGIPYCLKDIFDVAGMVTTCHSRIVPEEPAATDAAVVVRLAAAGAILLGKTALHEFGTGGPTFDLPFPPARNPWNRNHHPGGSSSGSGAAVSAGLAMAGIGTDTLGSVRSPATACGLVGLKPTYDVVPRRGCFPLAFSLDHVGPLTRTVEDCALIMDVVAEPARGGGSYGAELGHGLKGLRIGTLASFHEAAGAIDPDIEAGFGNALAALRDVGAEVVAIDDLPPLAAFQTTALTIHRAEAYTIHQAWLAERPDDYCAISREKLRAGASLGASDFITAQQARGELIARYRRATTGVDAVIGLSSFALPCRIDDQAALGETYRRHMRTPFNVLGYPTLSMPVGLSSTGLPLAVQLSARPHGEPRLLRIADGLERALGRMNTPPGFAWEGARPMGLPDPAG